jgi:hypothetical protein
MKTLEKNYTKDFGISASESTTKETPFIEDHLNKAYSQTSEDQLGWYENDPEVMLGLIDSCELAKDASILKVGSGSTHLVDRLW